MRTNNLWTLQTQPLNPGFLVHVSQEASRRSRVAVWTAVCTAAQPDGCAAVHHAMVVKRRSAGDVAA